MAKVYRARNGYGMEYPHLWEFKMQPAADYSKFEKLSEEDKNYTIAQSMELIRNSLNPSAKQQGRIIIAAAILLILSTAGLISLGVVLITNLNTMNDNLDQVIATTKKLAASSLSNLQVLVRATTGVNDDVYFSCSIIVTLYNRMFDLIPIGQTLSIGIGILGLKRVFSPAKENSCCPTGPDCEGIFRATLENWKTEQKYPIAKNSDYDAPRYFKYLHLPNPFT